jgi:hypothetical protein
MCKNHRESRDMTLTQRFVFYLTRKNIRSTLIKEFNNAAKMKKSSAKKQEDILSFHRTQQKELKNKNMNRKAS